MYFLPGQYKVKLLAVKMIVSRKKDDLFIVECEILESNNPDRPVGSKASQVINLKQDAAMGNIKGFLAAANGIHPGDTARVDAEIDEDVSEYAVSSDNPLAGTILNLSCVNVKTRAGGDFTLHHWDPCEQPVSGSTEGQSKSAGGDTGIPF